MALLDLIKRAIIEPVTFYNRYKNQEEFYDNLVREYDYWFNDIIKTSSHNSCSKEGYLEIFKSLSDYLKDDTVMLELLRWEINETNSVTRRTAMNREIQMLPLTHIYEKGFKDTGLDIVAISALLMAGIYYMNLHRRCSPFCGIDLTKEDDRERIKRVLEQLADILFKAAENQKTVSDKRDVIAERMRQKGICEEDIQFFLAD